ncbi:hypothetical protein [Terriglobus sp. RCC_193]|uniref:hypothetical protein n=1 Tax=Terriglobus sp. RCC_193 TaxID=3239218 RepID=UPI003526458B
MATVSVELTDSTYHRLQLMAAEVGLPVEQFLDHISQPIVEFTQDQLAEIDLGLADIEAGRFAADEKMNALFRRFGS